MKERSVFSNYLNLELYQALVETFEVEGIYKFDLLYPKYDLIVDDALEALQNPEMLSIEDLRAYSLAFAGTEFETKQLHMAALKEVKGKNDVFCAVACSYFKDRADKDLMQQYLAKCSQDNFEKEVFSLLAFDENDGDIIGEIIKRIAATLYQNVTMFYGNAKMMMFLLDMNAISNCNAEVLTLLNRMVVNVPDNTSNTVSVLRDYGIRSVDAYEVAWYLRKKSGKYTRGITKTNKVECELKRELAQFFGKWTELDKIFIKDFGGDLGNRIYARGNAEWYKQNYGFKLPELSVNLKDNVGLKFMKTLLDDTEKCYVAKFLQLRKTDAKLLGVKFKEWHKDLQEYYQSIGPVKGANTCYEACEFDLSAVEEKYGADSYETYAKLTTINSFEDETDISEYARTVLKYSVVDFVQFIRRFSFKNQISEELINIYKRLRYVNTEALLHLENDLESLEKWEDVDWNPIVLELKEKGVAIEDNTAALALYRETDIQPEELQECLSLLEQTCYRVDYLVAWYEDGCLLRKLKEVHHAPDAKTEFVKSLVHDYCGKRFREWTTLTVCECLTNWELANAIYHNYCSFNYDGSSVYTTVMAEVIKRCVMGENVGYVMNELHSYVSLIGKEVDWIDNWLSIIKKRPEDFDTLATMDVNYGCIEGVQCWVTSIGVITDGINDKLRDARLPLWYVSAQGDEFELFLGAPFNGENYNWVLNKKISHDETVKVKLLPW